MINYETIKYNYEFKYYLQEKNPVLFSWLETSKSNLSEIPPKELQQILRLYKQFIESKENWFRINRTSKKNPPVITKNTLIAWLKNRVQFKFLPIPKFFPVHYDRSEEVVKEKAMERLLPVFEHIAQELPSIMNIVMHNIPVGVIIFPKAKLTLGTKEGPQVAGAQSCGSIIMLKEDELFESTKGAESITRHEIYHLIDRVVVDTRISSSIFSCRKSPVTYSDILNERLKGKLQRILENENKKTKEFLKDVENEISRLPQNFTAIEECERIYSEKIKALVSKHKIWQILSPKVLMESDSLKFQIIGADSNMPLRELFPRILDAYFYNKDILKQYNPEIYEIVEKEILPDLR